MTDERILQETIKLVSEGICVTLPVNGRSMLPFIIGGRESVILQRPSSSKVGDVVLAWVDNNRYVVHRIIAIEGEKVTLMGDGNLVGKEYCRPSDVKAVATHVVDVSGRQHPLDSAWRQRASRLWYRLRPVRRYLLGVYKLIYKV